MMPPAFWWIVPLAIFLAACKPEDHFTAPDPCDPKTAAQGLEAWVDRCLPGVDDKISRLTPPARSLSAEDEALFRPFDDGQSGR